MNISERYLKITTYITNNPIATVSTTGKTGVPHGAAVYVCPDEEKHIVYFLTKNKTQKYENLQANNMVSLTIVNPSQNSTLQAVGTALNYPRRPGLGYDHSKNGRCKSNRFGMDTARFQT